VSFLSLPCPCGYSLDEESMGTVRTCRACKRRYVKVIFGWSQTTPLADVVYPSICLHRKVLGESCNICPGGVAVTS
jgi:hypothetical protein